MKTEIINIVVCVIVALYVIIRLYRFFAHRKFCKTRKIVSQSVANSSGELHIPEDSPEHHIIEPDFRKLFLVKNHGGARKQSYMSQETYEQISRYLRVIAPNMTVTTYVDNVLRHHIEQNRDAINKLYIHNAQNLI